MGRYSFDNYSPYASYTIRPKPSKNSPDNIGRGQVTYLDYSWEELEKDRGVFSIDKIREALETTWNPVLIIRPKTPSWLKTFSVEDFSELIRRIGSYIENEKFLVGVIITSVDGSTKIWDAFIDAFKNSWLLADLHDKDMICYLKMKNVNFGLTVSCNENNWLDCCEAFAKFQLQNTWEKAPILLQDTGMAAGEHTVRESLKWHAGFSDFALDIGYKFLLRRVTYPKRVSSSGALPIRFWFVNNGSALCYMKFVLKIKLKKETREYISTLKVDRKAWQLGDIIHNEIVQLPIIEPGNYSILTGIFFDDDNPMKLSIESEEEDGFYELGEIKVDIQDMNELFHSWNDFYPEGYYPLEDPELPK